jgi:integrase
LRALRGDALDLAAGFLDCKASWSRLEGAKGTKSGKNRKVPLPRSVAETLAKYQKIHGQGILFSITGEKPIPERYIRETFAHALEAVGINPAEQDERRLTPHCLRVSYNTFQILAGTLPDQLREVIGHSSSEMTSRYTSLKPEHLTSLAIVAGQAFEPAPEPTPSAPQGPNLEALAAQLADALARLEALSGKPPESK